MVMHGSTALAVPLKQGQSLQIIRSKASHFSWKAYSMKTLWFQATFDPTTLKILESSDLEMALT